jgi:ferredoxin
MTARRVRAAVDSSLCEGHGLCLTSAPDVFEMGSDERAYVTCTDITSDLLPGVLQAAQMCPTQAITVDEEAPPS